MSRSLKSRPRVFGIGWHKTGTTTLGLALIKLGYSVLGCRLDMVHPLRRGDLGQVLALADRFDALQDVPWAALYQELDERYPGSRFVLTERDDEAWLRSAARHFGDRRVPLHEWLYGDGRLVGNEATYLARYRQHNREVREYFRDRVEDLLILNFENGDGWTPLCRFLDHEVPMQDFPHVNKGPHNYNTMDKIRVAGRRAIPLAVRRGVFCIRQSIRDLMGKPDPRNRFHNFRENRRERKTWDTECDS